MPQKGDKLYKVWTGALETCSFVDEHIAAGCTAPTWLCKNDRGRFYCSVGSYELTKKDAYEKYLKETEEAIPGLKREIEYAENTLKYATSEIDRVKSILKNL